MSATLTIALEVPDDLAGFRFPDGLNARLAELLDRQDSGRPLTDAEQAEAEGLVAMAEMLSLLRLRGSRVQ